MSFHSRSDGKWGETATKASGESQAEDVVVHGLCHNPSHFHILLNLH